MGTLKSRDGSTRHSEFHLQSDALSEIISQCIDVEVKFSDFQARLPKVLSGGSNQVIKVTNRNSGDFVVCSLEGLISLIQETLDKLQATPSLFDDMESFETKERIGLSAIQDLPSRAKEYSKEDSDALSRLLKRCEVV